MQIRGARVLLTGASGGIGEALARGLAGAGAELVLSGRRAEVLSALAEEIGARTVAADLSDPAQVHGLLEQAGDVEILVANAALPASGLLDSFTEEQIDRALMVNLRAPLVLAHSLIPPMKERGRGHLLFISSIAGKAASPGSALYSATKFGLRGAASALRAELHPHNIGVSAIFPGFIRDAGMFADSGVKLPSHVGTRAPSDVADAVVSAIEQNRGEIDVAPATMRVAAMFAGIAPDTTARVQRRLGAAEVSRRLEQSQLSKR